MKLTESALLDMGFVRTLAGGDSVPGWNRDLPPFVHADGKETRNWLRVSEPATDFDNNTWWPIDLWQQYTGDAAVGVALILHVKDTTVNDIRRVVEALS